MAPINLPDGSQVSEIVLPDGSTASEVLAPDGSTVFSAIPDSGVARYTFNNADTSAGTAIDSWGNNDATINGATTGVSGELGEAYDFDGTNDYVDTPVSAISGGMSISVWANASSTQNSGFASIISNREESGASAETEIDFNTDNSEMAAYLGETEVASATLITDQWVHHCLTWNGSTAEYYVDGSSVGTESVGSVVTSRDFDIGRRPVGDNHIVATIDDPRIYDKGLSSTEVSNLYNTGSI
jgi:hypothetical protein